MGICMMANCPSTLDLTMKASCVCTSSRGRLVSYAASSTVGSRKKLEAIMVEIRALGLAYASSIRRDLPGLLGEHVTDSHSVDSSSTTT
jgi:hypothetical protein